MYREWPACVDLISHLRPEVFQRLRFSSSRWRYSRGWALASATICLQVSQFLALSLHSFTPIFLRSMDTSSSHLILGLPLRLVAYSIPSFKASSTFSIIFPGCNMVWTFRVPNVKSVILVCPGSLCQYVPRLVVGFRNNYFLQGEVVSLTPMGAASAL